MNDTIYIFQKYVPKIGAFRLRRLQISHDMALIHDWVNREYACYWGLLGATVEQVEAEYRKIAAQADVYIGYCNEQPAFLLECYDPEHAEVAGHYDWQSGDLGMHILTAPAERKISGFTWAVFTTIMDFIFADPAIARVVVEPDVGNDKIHTLNKRAGFEYQKIISLTNKTAYLAFCSRTHYRCALNAEHQAVRAVLTASPSQVVSHLRADVWANVNKLHLCKAISEFAHELLIQPELQLFEDGWGHYLLKTDKAGIDYRFRARVLRLEHWHIDKESLEKRLDGNPVPLDSLSFIMEISRTLGIDSAMLGTYMEEITSTLYSSAYKHSRSGAAAELLNADFQTLETAMMEGHPTFLANNGRIGFDAVDYHSYAPEAAAPVQLIWLAVHKSKAEFSCAEDLSYQELIEQELGSAALEHFRENLERQGLAAGDYWLMPTHPWQWYNKLAILFATDIAARELVCLGYGEDAYLAQQSIRTFFNISRPEKRYVKTALSILNMGFMRGLSPYYMSATPAICDCINRLIEQDPYLQSKGFSILREVAAIGYRNSCYETAPIKDSGYKKMLAALWRENPLPRVKPGQRLMTMAALLHIDAQGMALLPVLIKASGLDTASWLRRYLDCYLSPLLHCLYAYDLSFMPHGENLILILENNVPIKAIMKDIAEEAAFMNNEIVLSEKIQRLAVFVPEELKTLEIFIDCFDLIFRYLAAILLEQADFQEHRFWCLVADCILDYQRSHPEWADKFARLDLFAPDFLRSCLNRLQLANNRQMIDLSDPTVNLKFAGRLKNPIAEFKPVIRAEAVEASI